MRKRYVWDREKEMLVEKGEQTPAPRMHIMPDIQPYQVVGPEYGRVISSRSTHRQYLRRHGLIEIGDQKPKWLKK